MILSYDVQPNTKEKIIDMFKPYIKHTSDIITNGDLNDYLGDVSGKYKSVERKFLSSNETKYTKGSTAAGTDYYYRYGNVLFIVLDTNNYNCATHQNVIKKAVSENKDALQN